MFLHSTIQVRYDALTDKERFTILGLSASQGAFCTLRGPHEMTIVRSQDSSRLLDSKCDVAVFLMAAGHTFDVELESDKYLWQNSFVNGVLDMSSHIDKAIVLKVTKS